MAIRSVHYRADGRTGAFARRALKASAAVATAALVALSIGASIGRWRVVPVYGAGDQTNVGRGDLVMLVPMPAVSVQEGDKVFFSISGERPAVRTVIELQDSWKRQVAVDVGNGELRSVQLPPTVPRVTRVVPHAGWVFGLLVGPIQAIFLVANGILLIALSQRRPHDPPPPATQASGRRSRSSRPRLRVAAAAIGSIAMALGVALLQ
ncbi:MAG: hypothetical protein ACT4OX_00740 [Actinomycetota bacterium]